MAALLDEAVASFDGVMKAVASFDGVMKAVASFDVSVSQRRPCAGVLVCAIRARRVAIWQHGKGVLPGASIVNPRLPFASLLAACLAACATAPPTASVAGKQDTVSVPLPLGGTISGGETLSRVMPAYPPAMLASCPALQEVEVVVHVDAEGRVGAVYGFAIDDFPPPWETFFAVVRPAVMQWHFEPLRVEHWAADAGGNAHAVDGKARAFSRMYRFRFTCHAGETSVSADAERPPAPR